MRNSILVKVRSYASLREELGIDKRALRLYGSPKFASLMEKLGDVLGDRINIILDSEGALKGNVMVSVNGKLVNPSDLACLNLRDRDEIDIMPLPSGG